MKIINKLDRYLEDKNYEIIIKENKINIINFKEIIDFSVSKITLRCDNKIINIEGKNLIISKMLDEELAIRKGEKVEIEPRKINIYNIKLLSVNKENKQIEFEVECSKGTYIRSLCENIAEKLGTIGYMSELERIQVGEFNINKSVNKRLNKDEININIEFPENYNKIENLIEHIKEFDKRKIAVYDGYNIVQIKVEDIMYFYSDGNYNFCKTNNKEYRVKNKLYEIDKVSNDFVRISKGCIINIKQVKSFDIGENRNIIVKFNDDSEQYVARRKIKEVMNYLDERMI